MEAYSLDKQLQAEAKKLEEELEVQVLVAAAREAIQKAAEEVEAGNYEEARGRVERLKKMEGYALDPKVREEAETLGKKIERYTLVAEARKVLDQLAADQIPPAPMARVPPAVYQGFLKNLRSRL